jgi:hypothetical protein
MLNAVLWKNRLISPSAGFSDDAWRAGEVMLKSRSCSLMAESVDTF